MSYVTEYCNDYLEKIYYFCLRKTGNACMAQELSSDISYEILLALNKGTVPASFQAWVWKIAKNRYARWAKNTYFSKNSSIMNIEDTEEAAEQKGPEEEAILKEELLLVRRELAFICADYRNILVAHYIEGKSVSVIAEEFKLPLGTVKTKLINSRKKLERGMNMAREFGQKSYKPEELMLVGTGCHPSGLPNSALGRLIPKNIVLHAHNFPSTAEELSMELGIALPYMEEEIRLLYDATLLKKIKNKYITNFYIADKEVLEYVDNLQLRDSKQRGEAVYALIEELMPLIIASGIKADSMSNEDFMWLLVCECADSIVHIGCYMKEQIIKRPDGGDWNLTGHTTAYTSKIAFMGQNGAESDEAMLWVYGPHDFGMCELMNHDKNTLSTGTVRLLTQLLSGKRNIRELSEDEHNACKRLVHEENGRVIADITVYPKGVYQKLWREELLKCSPYERVLKMFNSVGSELLEYLKKRTEPILHSNLNYTINTFMYNMRMLAVKTLADSGKLKIPKNAANTNATTYLVIK